GFFAALSVATLLAAGCSGSSASEPIAGHSSGGHVILASHWAVVACPTGRGVPGQPAPRYPKQVLVNHPSSVTAKLALYSDNVRNLPPVLAPKGWKCRVEVGADGGSHVTIHPPGTPLTSPVAVTVQGEPACQDCMYGLVCPLIPDASKQVGSSYGAC